MATVQKFEDLEVWQLARSLSKRIFGLTLKENFLKELRFREQIKASSGSVMDNIAEGFERDGNRELINFLTIAKGSLGELKSQLHRAKDWKLISNDEFEECYQDAVHIGKKIGSLILYLQKCNIKGLKFR